MRNAQQHNLHLSDSDRLRLQADIENAVEWLAQFGLGEDGGVTRLLYTPVWLAAQQALAERMAQQGLAAYFDDCGNLFGRLEGTADAEGVILTGSHVDTVRSGGKYDGAYGILAGMLALRDLRETYGPPKRTIEVVSLCEEEGSRFPVTYWGSGNITGRYGLDRVPDITDQDGVSLVEAMTGAGFGSKRHRSPRRKDITGFVELHIEQGFVLERENQTVGIVLGIVGQRRYTVRVTGTANHAGTTPMKYRSDALAGACEMIGWLEGQARFQTEPFVSTVGQLHVEPNTSNVIPGQVSFTIDVRDASEDRLERFCVEMRESFGIMAGIRNLSVELEEWMNMPPAFMNDKISRELASICRAQGLTSRTMFSGAGHDAQVISGLSPTAMLFVPSKAGISHSPQEFSRKEDLAAGISVLTEWLYRKAYLLEDMNMA